MRDILNCTCGFTSPRPIKFPVACKCGRLYDRTGKEIDRTAAVERVRKSVKPCGCGKSKTAQNQVEQTPFDQTSGTNTTTTSPAPSILRDENARSHIGQPEFPPHDNGLDSADQLRIDPPPAQHDLD